MTKQELAWEVHNILEFPRPYGWHIRASKAYKIVGAIADAIVKGLKEDGRVEIEGLGIFTVKTVRAHAKPVRYFYGNLRGTAVIRKKMKAKKYVHFKPSKTITRVLNETQSQS